MRQARLRNQEDVVCKMTARPAEERKVLQSPRLALELSCCLQDWLRRSRPARSVQRNALGRKLRCCLQDSAAAVCDRGLSVAAGCARRRRVSCRGTASSSLDSGRATCAGCPGNLRGTRDRKRFSPGGSPCAAVAGRLARYRPSGAAETSKAGNCADNSGMAVLPFGCCRTTADDEDLETAIECLPRLRQWVCPTTSPGEMRSF